MYTQTDRHLLNGVHFDRGVGSGFAPWIHVILLHFVNISQLLTSTYCKYLAPSH